MRSPGELDAMLTEGVAAGLFSDADVEGLPAAVQSYFRAALTPGTPLALAARLRMRGRIKLGVWLPFQARQVLAPHRGTVWSARVGGVLVGSDQYADGSGGMHWKLAGLVPVIRAEGPDVARSSGGRVAAEAFWLPTALLPRFGVAWTAEDETHISARFDVGAHPAHVHYHLNSNGRVQSLVLDRWGDPDNTGTWALHPFGIEVTNYATFDGVAIPNEGRAGWHFGSDRWNEGIFFRYKIVDLKLDTT